MQMDFIKKTIIKMAKASYPAWLFQQSAVIPYRWRRGEIEILLITTRKGRWIVPKGVVEPDLSPAESAAKEALEEAGVRGVVHERKLGRYSYEKWEGVCSVEVYLLRVTKAHNSWDEDDFRRRQWLPLKEAVATVSEPALRRIMMKVPERVRGGDQ
jgi:8-oxo-dGTP pyrophosphatase MutT (NUDIX family)